MNRAACYIRRIHNRIGLIRQIMFAQGLTHIDTARSQKCIRHTAADNQMVNLLDQMVQHVELGRNLCPAHDSGNGMFRRAQGSLKRIQLSLHRTTGISWQDISEAFSRHVRTMRRRKGIVYIKIAVGGNGACEFRIIRFLARPKPRVFEERDITIGQYTNRLRNNVARYFWDKHDLAAKHFLQGVEHHRHRHFAMLRAIGSPEMGKQQDLGSLIRQFQHRRQQRTHARFFRHTPVSHGDVQVNANQSTLALDIAEVVERAKCHLLILTETCP